MKILAHIIRAFAAVGVGLLIAHLVWPGFGLATFALIAVVLAALAWVIGLFVLMLGEGAD